MSDILKRPALQTSAKLFAEACRYSREHSALVSASLEKYGDHGSHISGIVREHFPDPIKEQLRLLARNATTFTDAAWQARPPRVRTSTMRQLSRAVATRDGSGFYGPQGDKN